MSCRLVRRHIGVMVDGELDPATQIEFERHVAECAGCQELLAFEQSMRLSVREALSDVRPPGTLRSRMLAALDEADQAEAEAADSAPRRRGLFGIVHVWPVRARQAVPLAAVAAAALLLFGGQLPGLSGGNGSESRAGADQASVAASPMLEDVVRLHSSALPADVPASQPRQVARYFQGKVTFPVHTAEFGRPYVRLTGARLANVRERRAAALYYDVRGHRMTLVVFQPPASPFPGRGMLRAEMAGHRLAYEQVGGHVVPLRQVQGLTYAMTGDLSRRQLLQLAASLHVHP